MTRWGKVALFAAGVCAGAFVEWYFLHQPSVGPSNEEPWALPDFHYGDEKVLDTEDVYVTGTLIGDDVGYPVNTYNIRCDKTAMSCRVADVEEIARRQLGEISVDDWPIVSWTPTAIVVQSEVGPSIACARNTITLDRQKKTVRFLSEPINSASDFCTKGRKLLGPLRVEDWRIGNPKQPWGGYLGKP